MYWIENGRGEGVEKIKALAVGSEKGNERKVDVCVVTKVLPEAAAKAGTGNGHLSVIDEGERSELLRAPTATPSLAQTEIHSRPATRENKAVQDGTLVDASRPEPQTFVTAQEGELPKLEDLKLSEKTGPHHTAIANLLDPNLHVEEDKKI